MGFATAVCSSDVIMLTFTVCIVLQALHEACKRWAKKRTIFKVRKSRVWWCRKALYITIFSSGTVASLIASWHIVRSRMLNALSVIDVSELLRIFICCKAPQSNKLTGLPNYSFVSYRLPRTPVYTGRQYVITWMAICYFWCSVVSLHLCKEYLTKVKFKTTVLLAIKYWCWYVTLQNMRVPWHVSGKLLIFSA